MPEAQYIEDKKEVKESSSPRAEDLLKRYEHLKGGRKNFESYWQSLHDYFYIEAQDFNKTSTAGSELDANYLWDSTTLEAADVLASGFMNYLTPPTSKWFRLRHADPSISENKAVGDFLENVAEEVNGVINRSNFYDQMFPSYKSSGVFGTSVLFQEEDVRDDARFFNIPLNQVLLWEDAKGRVCGYFLDFEYTANQAASRWGMAALSSEMQQEIKENAPEKKHKFVLFIAERNNREIQKSDKKNLPIEAVWIDVTAKKIVEEGGYHDMPATVHRFDKRPNTPWGYSPAMKSLPFARMLNAIAKTNLSTMMQQTYPAVAVPDNAFIMPFNRNPRAINYYNKEKMGSNDIFALQNFGNPQVGLNSIEYYSAKVKTLMYNDVFLGFSNITKEMNNPEIMERINEKMTMLGPAVGRSISEVLKPNILRIIGTLSRKGKLPEPPDELRENPFFEIDFVGSLAQAQRRTELNTLVTGLQMVGQMAQMSPDVLDKVDPDKVTDEVWSITGAPVRVLRDDAEIAEIRKSRAESAMQQQQMAQVAGGAMIAKDASAAAAGFAKAKESKK